jgi:arsenate reductase
MTIDAATDRDLPAVRRLLERLRLPLDGVDDHVRTLLVAREDGQIVGTAGLEVYADAALLRSVAVGPTQQGRRIGHQLTDAALRLARTRGVATVYLLTTTAERFFPKFGFEQIAREEVPAAVRSSVEFRSACPTSATVMRKRLVDTVLFACVHNAGRSQMAAAWFNRFADGEKARAISAGTQPAAQVHPEVVATMREVGIDLAGTTPIKLTQDVADRAQMLVTMGCGDECPFVPGMKRDDWPLEDPRGRSIEAVREIRDQVRERVRALIEGEGWAAAND